MAVRTRVRGLASILAWISMTAASAAAGDPVPGGGGERAGQFRTVAASCACDCESYCKDVARRYADEHIHFPDWFGTGNPTRIPVTILGSTCQYSPQGPCNFSCWVNTRNDQDGSQFHIIVLLYEGAQYHATTSTGLYDLCSYNPQCPGPAESGMKLIPAGCIAQ